MCLRFARRLMSYLYILSVSILFITVWIWYYFSWVRRSVHFLKAMLWYRNLSLCCTLFKVRSRFTKNLVVDYHRPKNHYSECMRLFSANFYKVREASTLSTPCFLLFAVTMEVHLVFRSPKSLASCYVFCTYTDNSLVLSSLICVSL